MSLDPLVNNIRERKYFGEITGPHTQFCTLSQISRQQALESNERKKEWDARGRHTPFFLTPTLCKQYSWTIIRFSEKLTDGEKTWKLQRRAGTWTNFEKKKAFMQCFLCWLCLRDCVCERVKLAPRPSPPQQSWRRVWGTLLHIFYVQFSLIRSCCYKLITSFGEAAVTTWEILSINEWKLNVRHRKFKNVRKRNTPETFQSLIMYVSLTDLLVKCIRYWLFSPEN